MNVTDNKIHQHLTCASAALSFFGVKGVTWNDRTKKNVWAGTLRRAGFSVRSRMSKLSEKTKTVGASRKILSGVAANDKSILAFIVRVRGHVLVLDREGKTIVDTAKRLKDKRKIKGVFAVMKSAGCR